MGQQFSSLSETNRLYELPLNHYTLKQRINWALSLWKNNSAPFDELIQHRMIVTSQADLQKIYQIFKLRHLHLYLSSTKYLTCQQHGIKGCGEYYKGNIYLESAIASLSKINDIPFLDSLHLYAVALKGFEILYRKFGYFEVFQDMFHIGDNGKVKVWCNAQLYKLAPQAYLLDPHGTEADMAYRIINIIDDNVDKTDRNNMKELLYRKLPQGMHFKSFEQANQVFRQVCREGNWQPPERLKCISRMTREDIGRLLQQQIASNGIRPVTNRKNQSKESIMQVQNMLTMNSLGNQAISSKRVPDGMTSIRLPQVQMHPAIQTQTSTQPQTQSHMQTQFLIHSPQPQPQRYHSPFPFSPKVQNSDRNSLKVYGNSSTFKSLNEVPINVNVVRNEQPRFVPRANTPESRPRVVERVVESKPMVRVMSVQKAKKSPAAQGTSFTYLNLPPKRMVNIQSHPNLPSPTHISTTIQIPQNLVQSTPASIEIQNRMNPFPSPISPRVLPQPDQNPRTPAFIRPSTKYQSYLKQRGFQKNQESNHSFQPIQMPENKLPEAKKEEIPEERSQEQNKEKVVHSIIIPELAMNSEKSSNRSRNNIEKNTYTGLEGYKSAITEKYDESATKAVTGTFHFQQRFEQSIQPQESLFRDYQMTTPRYLQPYRPLSPTPSKQTYSIYSNPPTLPSSNEYTDPQLLSLLSKDRSSITINPTFNFTLSHQTVTKNTMAASPRYGGKEDASGDNQLYFSFSNSKNKEKEKEKEEVKYQAYESYSNTYYNSVEGVIGSQNLHTSKKYETKIDREIWQDLQQLKKHKNFY